MLKLHKDLTWSRSDPLPLSTIHIHDVHPRCGKYRLYAEAPTFFVVDGQLHAEKGIGGKGDKKRSSHDIG